MASTPPSSPFYPERFSVLKRIKLRARLYFFKFLTSIFFGIQKIPGLRNNLIQPTFTKVYPCHPSLSNHVFFPKDYKSGELLPLYLDVHGGGFAFGDPILDAKMCSPFCNNNRILVVSLNYPKTPAHPFPAAVHAIIDLVNAVLNDEKLPIDKSKVAIGGFSAGANLSLAATQDESLQGKIGGVVAYYPPVDFTLPRAEMLASRPKDAGPDPLVPNIDMFNWGYFGPDQDLMDPQLSVTYAPREKLPPKVAIIGCELDLLCRGSEIMAEKLAETATGPRTGSDICWEQNSIRWEKILGEIHGFDLVPAPDKEASIRVQKRAAEMYAGVAEWLFREVYV